MIQAIGRQTIKGINHLLNLLAFAHRISSMLFRRPGMGGKRFFRLTLEQIYHTATQALPVMVLIAVITGSTIIVQFTRHFATVDGRYVLGNLVVILIVRELGPLFTALIVILRSAVAATVATSYMSVSGKLDALELQGMDPLYLICLPRLVGVTVTVLGLLLIFDMVAILGGYSIAWAATDAPMESFLDEVGKAMSGIDITVGIVKAIFFGFTITVTSLYRGFRVEAITQIPEETSKAVTECLLYCLFVNVIISVTFYI